ncbi:MULTISPECIES: type II toxin-antitoxin system VapC family toxin [Halomicrobium]|uniref:Ribonuclease VapC n=2 Tax=Halomicrobium mukohataei TaxID=57705 RepID=C7P3C9_HALMD|nr:MULTISPECIES: PIN domain-containing protein [Halomicrobium]ACV47601.1 PilT protein domain protein [Halomicrobium mukohataei DSM 12286]QCD66061.1 type II toxin-antitoxin system VapC family toxin [Halomicrobium mukohataei]QFR20866.1 PIN domain-containing protein [Halomicrobium sp. ZPS1]
MTVLFDTNVLVAAVTADTDRSDEAIELLNQADDPHVSVLSLMELRSVLTKKKQFERERIEQIEQRISSRTTVTFPDASDMIAANRLQSETLLYPMDAMILAAADAIDATLVSFDSELVEHGAKLPTDVL